MTKNSQQHKALFFNMLICTYFVDLTGFKNL